VNGSVDDEKKKDYLCGYQISLYEECIHVSCLPQLCQEAGPRWSVSWKQALDKAISVCQGILNIEDWQMSWSKGLSAQIQDQKG
jgi:hypothetical protein